MGYVVYKATVVRVWRVTHPNAAVSTLFDLYWPEGE